MGRLQNGCRRRCGWHGARASRLMRCRFSPLLNPFFFFKRVGGQICCYPPSSSPLSYSGGVPLGLLTSGMKPIWLRWLLSSGSWNAIIWEKTVRYSGNNTHVGERETWKERHRERERERERVIESESVRDASFSGKSGMKWRWSQ